MEQNLITLVGMGLGTCFAITVLIAGRAIAIAGAKIAELLAEQDVDCEN